MRITMLNQFFGILAVTATLRGTETAFARNAAALPPPYHWDDRRRGERARRVGQGSGDMMWLNWSKIRRARPSRETIRFRRWTRRI